MQISQTQITKHRKRVNYFTLSKNVNELILLKNTNVVSFRIIKYKITEE